MTPTFIPRKTYIKNYMFYLIFYLFLICTSSFSYGSFQSKSNQIYMNNKEISIKGINWFGFETECNVIHGLWSNSLDFYFDFLSENNFNALRIPISYEMSLNEKQIPTQGCIDYNSNQELQNKNSREILHILFEKAQEHNMLILLDMHTKDNQITPIAELEYINAWMNILPEFQAYHNLMGIDLKNEPHMPETWNHWMLFVKTAMYHLDNIGYRGLYYIEGIQTERSGWGNDFSPIQNDNFLLNDPRVVFSPHVYGYSVRGKDSINDDKEEFDKWFGFLKDMSSNAIVITEFGGFYKDLDMEWHKKLFYYLKEKKLTSSFYWCLNPNSMDTHGVLLEDWKTPNKEKLLYLQNLNPFPTKIIFKKLRHLKN